MGCFRREFRFGEPRRIDVESGAEGAPTISAPLSLRLGWDIANHPRGLFPE